MIKVECGRITLIHHDEHLVGKSRRRFEWKGCSAIKRGEVTIFSGFDVDQMGLPICYNKMLGN
jgi:hypothetical protein